MKTRSQPPTSPQIATVTAYVTRVERLRARHALARARQRRAWKQACEHDKIDPDSPAVVFSPGNPHRQRVCAAAIELSRATLALCEAMDRQAAAVVG